MNIQHFFSCYQLMASVGHPPLDIVVVDSCAGVVYDYYYNGVEDRYSIDVFLCLKFPKQQTKKKGNSAYQGQRERWNEKIRHEPYAAIASSSPAQQQHHQPSTTTTSAKRQQLIKVQRQNGYDGKVFDAIQSLKNTRKRR